MKKLSLILIFIGFLSCDSDSQVNNCFTNFSFNQTVNLNNPQFIDLQVPNGYSEVPLGGRNLVIINRNSRFQAFDLQCPELDCNTAMAFDGLKLKCSCSNKEYNSLNGSPENGEGCFALEYNVVTVGGNTLQITR